MRHQVHPSGPHSIDPADRTHPWWQVMCLTGVDYFSTLAYLPGIAALVAGALSPLATLLIVVLTLFGVLPMYRRVAEESPEGQGSIAIFDRLLSFWRGKFVILVLLGFVVTSWIVTITLSAADASVHVLENPLMPPSLAHHAVLLTILLLVALGGVFLLGFTEAIGIAVPVVVAFLGLNLVVVTTAMAAISSSPDAGATWLAALTAGTPTQVLRELVIVFPLLVLGLSGFETGVSMMPLISATGAGPRLIKDRVRNTRRLLTTAAWIMSGFLITTSLVTTILIPAEEFAPGGKANGRALAYLAHELLGEGIGTAYDIVTTLILWFAGASAMAGLVNIVPRFLPGYGMAPEWGRAVRPVVLVLTVIAVVVTVAFDADVGRQAGAYATGILAIMVSGAVAVTLSARHRGARGAAVGFGVLSVVLGYALIDTVLTHPDGIAIAGIFVLSIIAVSLVSRVARSIELRVGSVSFDEAARRYIAGALREDGVLRVVAKRHEPGGSDQYAHKVAEQHRFNPIPDPAHVLFLEVGVDDPSRFTEDLVVHGVQVDGYRVLRVSSPAVPNAVAGVLLALASIRGVRAHCYFAWSEGSPLHNLLRYFMLGQGDTPVMVREIIRRTEPDPERRPTVHVGG